MNKAKKNGQPLLPDSQAFLHYDIEKPQIV